MFPKNSEFFTKRLDDSFRAGWKEWKNGHEKSCFDIFMKAMDNELWNQSWFSTSPQARDVVI